MCKYMIKYLSPNFIHINTLKRILTHNEKNVILTNKKALNVLNIMKKSRLDVYFNEISDMNGIKL